MHRNIISSCLPKSNVNIYDEIISAIEYEFNKPAQTIAEIKDRENKKRKGDIWEHFCKDWLLASGCYTQIWLLEEYITDFPQAVLSKQDNGIDIIGKTLDGWHAIQCKYRGKGARVSWQTLSTFIAMCERTKSPEQTNWTKHIIMTNCTGITHKLPRTPKDKSICKGTLRNTKRDHWLRMIGQDKSHRIGIIRPTLTSEEIREQRLKYFTSQ